MIARGSSLAARLALPAAALILGVMAAVLAVVFFVTTRVAEDYRAYRVAQHGAEVRRLLDAAFTEVVSAGLGGHAPAIEERKQTLVREIQELWVRQGVTGIVVDPGGRIICLIETPWCDAVLAGAPEEGTFHVRRGLYSISGHALSLPSWGLRVVTVLPRLSVFAGSPAVLALVPVVLAGAALLVGGILLLIRRNLQRPVGLVLAGLAEGRAIRATGVSEIDTIGEAVNATLDALRVQNERLQALDRMKDGLLRDVSHELKTPVAKQAMQLELMRNRLDPACLDRTQPFLAVMESSVRRQQQVIRNLLDLARLEAGGRRPAIAPVALDALLRQVIEEYRFFLDERRITLETNLDPVTALGDEQLLWNVFTNLFGNAIKYLRKGEPGLIRVASGREGDTAVVRIGDNGIGLDAAELSRAFERFFQASAAAEGSGVGLTICRQLVEQMGGGIELASAGRARGATATVRLPLAS